MRRTHVNRFRGRIVHGLFVGADIRLLGMMLPGSIPLSTHWISMQAPVYVGEHHLQRQDYPHFCGRFGATRSPGRQPDGIIVSQRNATCVSANLPLESEPNGA